MKKIKSLKSIDLLSVLMLIAAIMFGGNAAMAAATIPANEVSPRADEQNLNTDLTGTSTTATQNQDAGLVAREIDKIVAKFMPWQFAEHTRMVMAARQVKVTNPEVEYPLSGSSPLDFTFSVGTSNISTGASDLKFKITGITSGDAYEALNPYLTVVFEGVKGKDSDGAIDEDLVAMVVSRDGTGVTMLALNYVANTKVFDANTIVNIHIMANMCSESQREVAPDNFVPVTKKVYLQKKVTNIVFTDEFLNRKMEIPFRENDLEDRALYNHRRKAARSFWLGTQTKIKVKPSDNMAPEDAYASEGVLNQIKNKFAVSENISFDTLNAICEMQFGKNSMSNEADVYMGNGFARKLMKLAGAQKMVDITLMAKTDKYGINFTEYACPLGVLHFYISPSLNDLGYGECAVVLDMNNLTRYVKYDLRTATVDMKQGGGPGGETREAQRRIWTDIDAVCTRGYNSILVGPIAKIFGMPAEGDVNYFVADGNKASASGLTIGNIYADTANDYALKVATGASAWVAFTPQDGDIIYLNDATSLGGTSTTVAAGRIMQYDILTTSWVAYNGTIAQSRVIANA